MPEKRASESTEYVEVNQGEPSRSIDISLPSTSASTLCQRDMSWIGGEYLSPNVDTLEWAHANGVPKRTLTSVPAGT